MGAVKKYAHSHEQSSEWFVKRFLQYDANEDSRDRDVHHHVIVDQRSGERGEGWGWSHREAVKNAWEDLRGQEERRAAVNS